MTLCLECTKVRGEDVDHTPGFVLPPLLVRFECFLARKGTLGEPQGAIDKDLPTRGKRVPSREASAKHRYTCVGTLVYVLTEIGYLRKADQAGRWVSVEHKDPRDLSVKEIEGYLARRFPRDPCRTHDARCVRCCLPHHLSTYNKTTEMFRKMADWQYFEERRQGGGPAWSKEKLIDVYAVARARRYKRGVHEIVPVEDALAFRDWLETEAVPPRRGPPENYSGERAQLYERALALYKETGNAKEVAQRLKLPYATAYFWCVKGRSRSVTYERIRAEMPRLYAYSLWWLQELGARYEEMAHAEYPLEGPFVTLNRRAGVLTIVGKGREGGKTRSVTLTAEQAAKVEAILKWRAKLGEDLREYAEREAEPVLFVTLADSRKKSGRRLSENAGPWNATMRAWARRYDEWCDANGRPQAKIDPELVMSHRIGRAVSISKLAKEGVAEKVIMLERGIEDHRTLEGYIHTTVAERREILEDAERRRLARRANGGPGPAENGDANGAFLEELRAQRKTIEDLQRTVEDLRADLRRKDGQLEDRDARIRDLMERVLVSAKGPA